MNKESYKELTIGFLVVMIFFLSVFVGCLSHKTDKLEIRMDNVEMNSNLK